MKYGVGIDISKGKSTVSILSEYGEIIKAPFDIQHTVDGVNFLLDCLKDIPKEDIKIVMEQTGTYHLPLLGALLDAGYYVVAQNALLIKKYLDSTLRKGKTDKKDSLKIASYTIEKWNSLPKFEHESKVYQELRFLSRRYLSFVATQSKEKIHFSNMCDLLFPGYYQLLNSSNFLLGLKVFEKYYLPSFVKQKKQADFIEEIDQLAKSLGHKNVGKTFALKVFHLAQMTLSCTLDSESVKLSVQSVVELLSNYLKVTNDIITQMDKLASTLPEYKVIREMPGCGNKLTCRIIAEIGDIRRLKNAGSLIAYAGLDSPPDQSGKFDADGLAITKRGNKYLRKTGYEIIKMLKLIKSENVLKDYLLKKENEGKAKKIAKIACLNKFLRMYYGIVKKEYKRLDIWQYNT